MIKNFPLAFVFLLHVSRYRVSCKIHLNAYLYRCDEREIYLACIMLYNISKFEGRWIATATVYNQYASVVYRQAERDRVTLLIDGSTKWACVYVTVGPGPNLVSFGYRAHYANIHSKCRPIQYLDRAPRSVKAFSRFDRPATAPATTIPLLLPMLYLPLSFLTLVYL